MGFGVSSEEAGHGKLQCHCHFSSQLLPLHSFAALMYYWYHRASVYHGTHPKYSTTQEGRC